MIKRDRYLLMILSVVFAFTMISHSIAISLTKAAYMISVKRLSMVFAVILGWLFFKERNISNRLIGSVIMLLGVVIITLSG